jgi:hypothetical protein
MLSAAGLISAASPPLTAAAQHGQGEAGNGPSSATFSWRWIASSTKNRQPISRGPSGNPRAGSKLAAKESGKS